MTARLVAGHPAERGIIAIRGIERQKFPVPESCFADKIDQPLIERAQALLFGRKPRPIVFVIVYPLREFGHRPVIEDAGARVVAAETLRAGAGLADFLAVVEQDRAAREAVKNR